MNRNPVRVHEETASGRTGFVRRVIARHPRDAAPKPSKLSTSSRDRARRHADAMRATVKRARAAVHQAFTVTTGAAADNLRGFVEEHAR